MTGFVTTLRRAEWLASALIISVVLLPNWAMGESSGVYHLTQSGWTIIKQIEKQEVHSGVSPYAHLQRVVSVTEYHLEKDGQTMICRMSYDSQQDIQEEECEQSQV